MPDHILFIIGENAFAVGAKLDWTLFYKPLYLAWYLLPAFILSGVEGRKLGIYATIAAIISVEIEQGLAFKYNTGNYFGLYDIAVVLILLFILFIVQTRCLASLFRRKSKCKKDT